MAFMTSLPSMTFRRLGKTELLVSRLALGTVELGLDYGIQAPSHYGRPNEQSAVKLVHSAIDRGINLLDTARAYGASESVLGRALQGRRHKVVLATKVTTQGTDGQPLTGRALRQHMRQSLNDSLSALRTDYVDIWQIHNVDLATLTQIDTVTESISAAKESGLIRWAGASFYGAELPISALSIGLFDIMQVTYSVLDQRLADHFFNAAASNDVGIIVRSVLLKGALTERAEYLPQRLDTLRDRSLSFRKLVAQYLPGWSPAQVAIAFALTNQQIDAVLVGIRSDDELEENLKSIQLQIRPDLLEQLCSLRLDDAEMLNPATWGIP